MPRRRMATLMALTAGIALALLVALPLLEPAGSLRSLDGSVGVVDNAALWDGMGPATGLLYRLGDLLCHQMEGRSLIVNGNQMAFCARDLGILAGFLVAAMAALARRWEPPWWLLLLMLAPIALDGGMQALSLHESSNLLRLSSGALGGAALALGLLRVMEAWWSEALGEG